MKHTKILSLLLFSSTSSFAHQVDNPLVIDTSFTETESPITTKISPMNGFTQIVIDTTQEQKKPLETVVTLELPMDITNVGQAMNYVLQNSGFHLQPLSETSSDTIYLYTIDLPLGHRLFYQATINQIIETLAGEGYEVVVNHVRREIQVTPLR